MQRKISLGGPLMSSLKAQVVEIGTDKGFCYSIIFNPLGGANTPNYRNPVMKPCSIDVDLSKLIVIMGVHF